MTHPLKHHITNVPDFPEKGVLFRDIAPLLRTQLGEATQAFAQLFTPEELGHVDAFAGLDARGFIFATALATYCRKNLILIRKGGKLPPPVVRADYNLEYGTARMEMQKGSGAIILIDDVLATGGTMRAAVDLATRAGYDIMAVAAFINLTFLNDFVWNGQSIRSVITYHE